MAWFSHQGCWECMCIGLPSLPNHVLLRRQLSAFGSLASTCRNQTGSDAYSIYMCFEHLCYSRYRRWRWPRGRAGEAASSSKSGGMIELRSRMSSTRGSFRFGQRVARSSQVFFAEGKPHKSMDGENVTQEGRDGFLALNILWCSVGGKFSEGTQNMLTWWTFLTAQLTKGL